MFGLRRGEGLCSPSSKVEQKNEGTWTYLRDKCNIRACGRCGHLYIVPDPWSKIRIGILGLSPHPAAAYASDDFCGTCYQATEPNREAKDYAALHPEEVLELKHQREKAADKPIAVSIHTQETSEKGKAQ